MTFVAEEDQLLGKFGMLNSRDIGYNYLCPEANMSAYPTGDLR